MKNDAQECRNDLQKHRMTPRMTQKKRMNSLLLKHTSEMIVWGGNKRLLEKRKIIWYTIPLNPKSLFFLEAKRVYFDTSQKHLLKGRRI